jgi:flavin-binding protein dodecin
MRCGRCAVRETPLLKPEASYVLVYPSPSKRSKSTTRTLFRNGHKTLLESRRTPSAMTAVKIIKVLGTSDEGWEQAAQEAVDQASETIDDIHGVEVEDWTADVENGQIQEYKTTVEVAFPVHDQQK